VTNDNSEKNVDKGLGKPSRTNERTRGTRFAILEFLEGKAGGHARVNEIVEKLGVKRGSIYATLSDLRRVGMLPKPDRTIQQLVPLGFDAEEALRALKALQRERDERRKGEKKGGV